MRSAERIAILPPENLGTPPDSEWVGRAVAAIAVARTSGDAKLATFEETTLRDAALHHATRSLSGYFTASGNTLSLTATLRDETENRNLRTLRAAGDVFALADAMASGSGAALRPYTTANAQAVEALYRGIASPDPATAAANVERAVALDPQFGSAHLARIDLLLRSGKGDEARNLIGPALTTRLTNTERARLEMLKAEISGDAQARRTALLRIAGSRPGDTELWTALASTQIAARDYRGAVQSLERILEVSPGDENALNLRGYAWAYAGDRDAALRAMEAYRRRLPESANAIDSQGEVNFYFGRFEDASRLFLEAHSKNPGLLNGIEPLRAAFALYMAGNLKAANDVVGTLRPNPPGGSVFRPAMWRWITGQPPGPLPQTPVTSAIQALWLLADGNRSGSAALAAKAQSDTQDPAARGVANLAALLSQPSTSPEEWKERLARALPAPQAAGERLRLLGWALLLDKQPAAAADVWRDITARTPPPGGNEDRLLLAWSLIEAGRIAEARQAVPHGFLPPDSFDPSLSSLLWHQARNIYQKIH